MVNSITNGIKNRTFSCLRKYQNMQTYSGVKVYLHAFATSALEAKERSTSCPRYFARTERAHGCPVITKLGGPYQWR